MHFAIAWRSAYTCEEKPPPLQQRRMSTPANLSWPRVSSGSYTCQGRRSLQTQFYFDRSGIPMAARWGGQRTHREYRRGPGVELAWRLKAAVRQHGSQDPSEGGCGLPAPAERAEDRCGPGLPSCAHRMRAWHCCENLISISYCFDNSWAPGLLPSPPPAPCSRAALPRARPSATARSRSPGRPRTGTQPQTGRRTDKQGERRASLARKRETDKPRNRETHTNDKTATQQAASSKL